MLIKIYRGMLSFVLLVPLPESSLRLLALLFFQLLFIIILSIIFRSLLETNQLFLGERIIFCDVFLLFYKLFYVKFFSEFILKHTAIHYVLIIYIIFH